AAAVLRRLRVRVLHRAAVGVRLPHHGHAGRRGDDDRHQRLPRLRPGDLPRLRHQLRAAGGPGDPGAAGLGHAGAAEGGARLRHRRGLRAGGGHHPARRGLAADAGDPDVPALRGRDPGGAGGGAASRRGGGTRPRVMAPAGFRRRAAAWSLDAAAVALLVLPPALFRRDAAGARLAEAWTDLLDLLAQRTAGALLEAIDAGAQTALEALPRLAGALFAAPALREAALPLQSALLAWAGPPLAAYALAFLLWSVGLERSPLPPTPGQRALGPRVAGADGAPARTGRLLLRFLAGGLSWLSLNAGHALAAIGPDHLALHDRISGTRVLRAPGTPAGLPGWARGWLFLLAAGLAAATAWGAAALAGALDAALDRALWG